MDRGLSKWRHTLKDEAWEGGWGKICDKNSKALNKSVMLNKGGSENLKKANT